MIGSTQIARAFALLIVGALAVTAGPGVTAQGGAAPTATPQATPEGYMPRGSRPGKGLAPGMKVILGVEAAADQANADRFGAGTLFLHHILLSDHSTTRQIWTE